MTLNERNAIVERYATLPSRVTSEERKEVELFDWKADPPDKYVCFPSEDLTHAKTCMGGTLGTLTVGRPWRSNFGDERRSVRVLGTNGKTYVGTLYGRYIRMRAVKE